MYLVRVKATLNLTVPVVKQVFHESSILLTIVKSDLVSEIQGGNRVNGYDSELVVKGDGRDLEQE